MEKDQLAMVGMRIGDTSDLPSTILKQLKSSQLDDLEDKVLKTITTRYQGIANVDEVIVGLYRDFKYETTDRKFVANKLYRMTKVGVLVSVKGKKGVYAVTNFAQQS